MRTYKYVVFGDLVIVLLLSLISTVASAQDKWQLRKEENGIRISTANTDNCSGRTVKVECIINATQTQLIAYLLDIEKQPEWIYNAISSRQVKRLKENELIFYSQVDVPWPCSDRDYIAHIVINQISPQFISIDSHAEPDLMPEKEGFIRVKESITHWDITTINSNQLSVVYTVRFEPGGSVPAWLTNLFIAKGPYNTFKKLREQVNKPQYQHAHLDFIKS